MVRLESTTYGVSESSGTVVVCARVDSPSGGCPIRIPFSLRISTRDNTAGICSIYLPLELSIFFMLQHEIFDAMLRQFGSSM